MFAGVLAIGILGGIVTRFRPAGMAGALAAMTVAQMLVGVIAMTVLADSRFPLVPNIFFVLLWLVSAGLFRKAGSERLHDSGGRG